MTTPGQPTPPLAPSTIALLVLPGNAHGSARLTLHPRVALVVERFLRRVMPP